MYSYFSTSSVKLNYNDSLNHHFTKQIKGFQTYQDKGKSQLER